MRNPFARKPPHERRKRTISLRWRIAGTMMVLVTIAGVLLSTWAYLADERLKRTITFDLLSEELTHFEQRMRVDRGAEPPQTARLRIYRSSDLAELPRRIAQLKPDAMHRVSSGDKLLEVLVKDGDFGRLYVTYDVTTHRRQEHLSAIVLALGVVGIVIVTAIAAVAISRRLVKPINQLSTRLAQIDPKERHVRITAEFAGNELEPIAHSVDSFFERLDGFVEREQSFTRTASHELRTPLAVIRGAVEILEDQAHAPPTSKALARIGRAVREMSDFIDALLTLSREDRASRNAEDGCDLVSLLPRIVEDQSAVVSGKHVDVQVAEQTAVHVQAPDSMVAIVVGNLVRNALQHGQGDHVDCRIQGRTLSVTNSGTISESDLGRTFKQPFTTRRGGSGMGLYLVRRICDRYGWQVKLQSETGATTATVMF
jgi:signal transduction histidine kinase